MTPLATYIVETLVTLVAVVALAVLVLVGTRRFGLGRAVGPLELVGRLPLEARRAVYLVRVFERVFVLGASEAGLEKLAELEGTNFIAAGDSKLSFKQALSRVLDRNQRGTPHAAPSEDSDATP